MEDTMNGRTFESPVLVETGARLIQEIVSLHDALDFLHDWPEELRDMIHATALRACQKAHDSDFPLETARQAFVRFAKDANILAEMVAPLPWARPRLNSSTGVAA